MFVTRQVARTSPQAKSTSFVILKNDIKVLLVCFKEKKIITQVIDLNAKEKKIKTIEKKALIQSELAW